MASADSEYNLGILYARGIGVEQNLAESFKWFHPRGGAGRLGRGPQARRRRQAPRSASQAAAKLAIQTFTPEPQPDDAINVAAPAGGWDSAPATAKQSRQAGDEPAGSAPRRADAAIPHCHGLSPQRGSAFLNEVTGTRPVTTTEGKKWPRRARSAVDFEYSLSPAAFDLGKPERHQASNSRARTVIDPPAR